MLALLVYPASCQLPATTTTTTTITTTGQARNNPSRRPRWCRTVETASASLDLTPCPRSHSINFGRFPRPRITALGGHNCLGSVENIYRPSIRIFRPPHYTLQTWHFTVVQS
ncbi:hypothetical protein BO86DRAFT_234682 [Aspergillus japonicus CBS 114.51]|uniref:Uncharacterized protein n=2 Tax=Aspergillus TaxID=5052 RepID=A0A2V5HNJ5_ASPV1|nr:hypothetical protein BO86DRAFT_234682 [Aspergillus japonicus CBS 114.51]PYI13527.1 hypothetical protein BO99DRAFT_54947 [Aspergillus violaceofuscus CBS 115571]RAH77040.1 hypothetical protein BO86DRAFT_234682 [Aspergillus japonicus CBS 114.51]